MENEKNLFQKKYIAIKNIVFVLLLSFWVGGFLHAISVTVPQQNDAQDVIVSGPSVINSQERDVFEIIQVVNRYLRFSIGAICMGVLVYAGVKLISASGEQEEMKKANHMLMGSVIGILIAILSYAGVRLIVNLL